MIIVLLSLLEVGMGVPPGCYVVTTGVDTVSFASIIEYGHDGATVVAWWDNTTLELRVSGGEANGTVLLLGVNQTPTQLSLLFSSYDVMKLEDGLIITGTLDIVAPSFDGIQDVAWAERKVYVTSGGPAGVISMTIVDDSETNTRGLGLV